MPTIEKLESMTRAMCTRTTDELFAHLEKYHGFTIVNPESTTDRFAIRLGSLPVVGVCHLDTVCENTTYRYFADSNKVVCSELDDRLGLASLLLIAKEQDITIVCCDNEETGGSTGDVAAAWLIENNIQVNWLFELDRRGIGAVTYDYSEPMWDGIVKSVFGELHYGSFSDISSMESLERKAFNAGIGYFSEHSLKCHAYLDLTMGTIRNTQSMIDCLAWVPMIHEPSERHHKREEWKRWNSSSEYVPGSSFRDYDVDDYDPSDDWVICTCESCFERHACEQVQGFWLCKTCDEIFTNSK